MHYFISISLLLFVFAPILKSQTFGTSLKLVEGMPETYEEQDEILMDFFVLNKKNLYVVRRELGLLGLGQRSSTLERYSSDLAKKDVSAWHFKLDEEFGDFLWAIKLDGTAYFFTIRRYEEEKKEHVYCWNFDEEGYKLTNKRKLVEIDQSLRSGWHSLNINFATSPDSSHIALYLEPQTSRSDRGDATVTMSLVLDKNLKKINEFTYEMPVGNNGFKFRDLIVNNEGSVFFLATEITPRLIGGVNRQPKLTHHLVGHIAGTEKAIHRTFEPEEEYISSMKLATDIDNYVYAIGINSTEWKLYNQESKGISTFKIDGQSGEIIFEKSTDFPIEFLAGGLGDRAERNMIRRAERGRVNQVDEYYLDRIFMGTDGDLLVVGEQRGLTNSGNPSSNFDNTSAMIDSRIHGGIMIIKLTKDGNIVWGKTINRKHLNQKRKIKGLGENTIFSSDYIDYNAFYSDNKLHLLYNDHSANLNLDDNSKPTPLLRPRHSVWVLATIDNLGNKEEVAINSYRDSKLLVIPSFSQQISGSEFALFASGHGKRFGVFKLYIQ